MQLLCFALSLVVIQYIDHAGKAHDHGKQNGTAKSAAGKADIRIEHNQCGRSIRMMGATVLNLSIKIPSFEQHSTQRLLCFQYSRNHREIYCATVEICPLHTICRGWFYCSAARNTVGVWR